MKGAGLLFGLLMIHSLGITQRETLVHFRFNDNSGFTSKEEISGNYFTVSTIKKNLEIVPSLYDSGLRTDGYSTSLNVSLPPQLKNNFNISGWFALETYPTDTAGFFVVKEC